MRKDFLNITAKITKKLHMQNAVYIVLKHMPFHEPHMDESEQYLDKLYPEKKNSCICENTISNNHRYDVQVIIPVYNVEKYVQECIESVLHQQTKYSYQAILVNDGSTDTSRTLLENYAQRPNITIIDKPNGGLSSARNIALQNIDARYVLFVDSDDYISENAIEQLVSKADASSADIVEGNHRYFQNSKTLRISSHKEAFGADLQLFGMACGKVYKAHIWQRISFPLGYWFEDTIDWLLIYAMPLKKVTIPDVLYHYRANPTSITLGNNSSPRRLETYWITKQLLADAKNIGIQPTQFYYETFLRQCRLNTSRVAILGDRKADLALFEAHRQLRDTYFKDMHAQGEKEKRIESALLNDDFKEYLLYCLFLY